MANTRTKPMLSVTTGAGGLQGGTANPQQNQFRQVQGPTFNPQPAAVSLGNFTNTYNPQNGTVLGLQTNIPSSTVAQQQAEAAAQQAAQAEQQRLAAARATYGDPSMYDQQIGSYQNQLNGLGDEYNVGVANVNDQYQKAYNGYNSQKAVDERNYNQSKGDNTTAYASNRSKTLNSVRSNANALQRLLGMNGAGNSSAALEAAPYAAGLQGTQDLQGAQQVYATNQRNLDQNWADAQNRYKNAFSDLDNQKFQNINGVKAQVDQRRATLLDQIAGASVNRNFANGLTGAAATSARNQYQPEIDSLLREITQLGRTNPSPIQAQTVAPANFSLANYLGRSQGPAQASNMTGGQSDVSPVLAALFGQKRDEYGNPVYA